MGDRIGGVAYVKVDGNSWPLRGSMQVLGARVKRTGVAGQDGVHGYTEMPVVPSIKGDASLPPGFSVQALEDITNATVIAELANGQTYVLRGAWYVSGEAIDTTEGKIPFAFEGLSCDEL